jgi:hypothetical protein
MRKMSIIGVFVAMVIMAMASVGLSQTWYPTNQKTVAWDAVTKLEDGTSLPAGQTVRYQIYSALSTDATKANKVNMGSATTAQFTATFTVEGKYFIGVEAERLDSAGVVLSKSAISWSDNAIVCQGGVTFGIVLYKAPQAVGGIRGN